MRRVGLIRGKDTAKPFFGGADFLAVLCIVGLHLANAQGGYINLSGSDYAGDLSAKEAWEILKSDESARLIDVRTMPEWAFVGIPDLASLSKKPLFLSWQLFPNMQQNPEFIDQIRGAGAKPSDTLLFICRSGGRSRMAAMAMTSQGFEKCYNIAGGFEGDHDGANHRGSVDGWKVADLPWIQE